MEFSIKKLPKSQIEIKVNVPPEEFQNFVNKAILELGKGLEVEGFRKGKIPKQIIEEKIGREKILDLAKEKCINENYLKVISNTTIDGRSIEPLGHPEIEVLKMALNNPFEFRIRLSVLPRVKLPDYKEIASHIQKREVVVTPEEIEKLRLEKEKIEREKTREEILEKIAQKSEVEIPDILLDLEKKRMLESFKKQVVQVLQIGFEDYLKKINKTEKELLDSFSVDALRRAKHSLILREIGNQENIEVSEEEAKIEEERILKLFPEAKTLDADKLREYSKEVVKEEKTFRRLEEFIKK